MEAGGILAGRVKAREIGPAMLVDQDAAHEEMRFRRDDERNTPIVDALRIKGVDDLGIVDAELLVRDVRYVEHDTAMDREAAPDLVEDAARRDVAGRRLLLDRIVAFHEALAPAVVEAPAGDEGGGLDRHARRFEGPDEAPGIELD